ncbi:MAG: O-antigen polymerase [Sediminicola sp.]
MLRTGFFKESLSDLLFILSFFGAFFLFSDEYKLPFSNDKLIKLLLGGCVCLFVATFLGFDQNLWGNTMGVKTADIEYNRSYRQGLFRKAHIASYFFTFFVLYFLNKFQVRKESKLKYSIILIPLAIFILLTGSRTSIVVIVLSLFLYYFKIKFLKFLLPLISLGIFVLLYIDRLLTFFDGSLIYQYLSIIKTLSTNFERLSRIIIWSSWWKEVKTFRLLDFIFGRGFNSSIAANLKNTSSSIWFHNDFLSIFYSYGLLSVLLYVYLFIVIYQKHKNIIKGNIFVFLTFSSFYLSAFFNGFYYYYTILILFLFYSMIRDSKLKSQLVKKDM